MIIPFPSKSGLSSPRRREPSFYRTQHAARWVPAFARTTTQSHGSRLLARRGDPVAEPRHPDWQAVDRDPKRPDRVVDGARDRRRRAEIAGLARAFLAKHGVRRRRHVMDDLDRRDLVRRRQEIIHEALRDELALVVVSELLVERSADAVGDPAHGHAAYNLRIDHRAAVVTDEVALDLGLAEIGVDRDQKEMELEREARVHLYAAVGGRQLSPGRHLHHVGEGEPWFGA